MTNEYISEIHELLKLGGEAVSFDAVPEIPTKPLDLPIAPELPRESEIANELDDNFTKSIETIGTPKKFSLIGLFVYPLIFIVAFGFFYVVLNFSAIRGQIQGYFVKPQAEEILGDQQTAYYAWIEGYYYAVNDMKLLEPNNDIDKDGLSNMDEFILRTNPVLADSDGDRYPDGTEVINGYNPWGFGIMTKAQKELLAKLDETTVNNRISFNAASGVVSGVQTSNYDLNKPGVLSIPKLSIQVPLIWSKDPAEFETDLTKGVIHYPGTALPGELGTIYVSGHSSDYLWKHDPMQTIFAKLNFLKTGDDVFVNIYGNDGKTYTYRYQVTTSKIFKPDDQTQFIDGSSYKLNLSTCWPIGTSTNRLVVSATQVGL